MRIACTLFGRLRGKLLEPENNGVLLMAPCGDVHTFGMGYPLDIALVDDRARVVVSQRAVPPGKRVRARNAVMALERRACCGLWPQVGDSLAEALAQCEGAAADRSVRAGSDMRRRASYGGGIQEARHRVRRDGLKRREAVRAAHGRAVR